MQRKWIWLDSETQTENLRACFTQSFHVNHELQELRLEITAFTRYIAYLNGTEIGRGPARSGSDLLFLDNYDLSSSVQPGQNHLAIEVWHHGLSTYQSIANQPRLYFRVSSLVDEQVRILTESNTEVKCSKNLGHHSFAPKRNVNLGFSDYYDARLFSQEWIRNPQISQSWSNAVSVTDWSGKLIPKPIKNLHKLTHYPSRLVSIEDVRKITQQVTINTREAFFPGRKDADETIFTGLIACIIKSPERMQGRIAFPNRTWNGIIGDFKINDKLYAVSNQERDIELTIPKGQSLFLLQASGKFDDLFCHIDFIFPQPLEFVSQNNSSPFFVIGPTGRTIPPIDGKAEVYGGINEYNRFDRHSEAHEKWFAQTGLQGLIDNDAPIKWVDQHYVFYDEYLLSLAMHEQIEKSYVVRRDNLGILWNNDDYTLIDLPQVGDYRRILVDFGLIRVGALDFTLYAKEGTTIDFYGFENYYHREIDFTLGLNNAVRYIAREGWQNYRTVARLGFRYLLITVRNAQSVVKIKDLHVEGSSYPPSNLGDFSCDDELINRIWQMCKDTQILSMEDCFADSPSYEQAFWLGDSQIGELVNSHLFGDYEFIWHTQKLAVSALDNTALMNALTPTDWTTAIPLWMMNWIISVFQTAELSGNDNTAKDLYPQMRDTLLHYEQFITKDGGFLINAWNMLDWAPLDIDNYGIVTGQQAALAYCYEKVAELASQLSEDKISAQFKMNATKLKTYIDTTLWSEERAAFHDGWTEARGFSKTYSMQTHVMLYLYKAIIDPVKAQKAWAYLMEKPADFVTIGSPFMLAYLYETWASEGESERIVSDIKTRWQDMLKFDSNTCWEVFPGFYENSRTRSYCHNWSTTPAYFFMKLLSGIKPLQADFSEIKLDLPANQLNWCRTSLPTRFGCIHISWERTATGVEVHLWLPESIKLQDTSSVKGQVTVYKLAE